MEDMEICSDVSDVLDLLLENIVIGANQTNLFGEISKPGNLPSGVLKCLQIVEIIMNLLRHGENF